MKRPALLALAATAVIATGLVVATDRATAQTTMDHSTMDHSTMDHSTMDHSGHAMTGNESASTLASVSSKGKRMAPNPNTETRKPVLPRVRYCIVGAG